jgi:hypothetical protein
MPSAAYTSSSFGETAAGRSRCFHHFGTDKAAAIASSLMPLSRRARKARNWSSGCRGARWTFSASEIFLRETFSAHDARDWCGASEALLLYQKLQRAIASAAGRDFEHAGLRAIVEKVGR